MELTVIAVVSGNTQQYNNCYHLEFGELIIKRRISQDRSYNKVRTRIIHNLADLLTIDENKYAIVSKHYNIFNNDEQ